MRDSSGGSTCSNAARPGPDARLEGLQLLAGLAVDGRERDVELPVGGGAPRGAGPPPSRAACPARGPARTCSSPAMRADLGHVVGGGLEVDLLRAGDRAGPAATPCPPTGRSSRARSRCTIASARLPPVGIEMVQRPGEGRHVRVAGVLQRAAQLDLGMLAGREQPVGLQHDALAEDDRGVRLVDAQRALARHRGLLRQERGGAQLEQAVDAGQLAAGAQRGHQRLPEALADARLPDVAGPRDVGGQQVALARALVAVRHVDEQQVRLGQLGNRQRVRQMQRGDAASLAREPARAFDPGQVEPVQRAADVGHAHTQTLRTCGAFDQIGRANASRIGLHTYRDLLHSIANVSVR